MHLGRFTTTFDFTQAGTSLNVICDEGRLCRDIAKTRMRPIILLDRYKDSHRLDQGRELGMLLLHSHPLLHHGSVSGVTPRNR